MVWGVLCGGALGEVLAGSWELLAGKGLTIHGFLRTCHVRQNPFKIKPRLPHTLQKILWGRIFLKTF